MNYLNNHGNKLVRQTLELSEQNVGYTSVLQYPEQLHPFVYAAMVADNVSFILLEAEKSREFADSYRNFRVGSAALAVYRRGEQMRKSFVHGANSKPVSGSDIINVHAEHTILSMVETGRRTDEQTHHVPLVGIIGDLQADQQSGTDTATLHPCGICREAFQEQESLVDSTSLIVTTNPDFTAVEWFSTAALARLHDEGDDSGIGRAEFSERHPMLTVPQWYKDALISGEPVVLADHDNEREAEREYEAKVRDPIFRYVVNMQDIAN